MARISHPLEEFTLLYIKLFNEIRPKLLTVAKEPDFDIVKLAEKSRVPATVLWSIFENMNSKITIGHLISIAMALGYDVDIIIKDGGS